MIPRCDSIQTTVLQLQDIFPFFPYIYDATLFKASRSEYLEIQFPSGLWWFKALKHIDGSPTGFDCHWYAKYISIMPSGYCGNC